MHGLRKRGEYTNQPRGSIGNTPPSNSTQTYAERAVAAANAPMQPKLLAFHILRTTPSCPPRAAAQNGLDWISGSLYDPQDEDLLARGHEGRLVCRRFFADRAPHS